MLRSMSRPLLAALLLGWCAFSAAALPRRGLAQVQDAASQREAECKLREERCYKESCSGKMEFTCPDDPREALPDESKGCICVSAGLASCFPGSATVATPGGPKPLAQLTLGEEVLSVDTASGQLRYSPVYMFTSRRPGEAARFLEVATDAGLNVTVTPGHYLFAWRGEGAWEAAQAALGRPDAWPLVLPGQLAHGDVLPVAAADWSGERRVALARVAGVAEVQGAGVFMPHTLSGAIVVDGVVASELTSIVPPTLAGPYLQRGLAAGLRLAFKALPAAAVEAAVARVSGWAHGVADAAVSRAALVG